MKVLMFGPGRYVKGGISTVVNLYFTQWNFETYPMRYISTMEDGNKLKKSLVFLKAFVQAIFLMPSYDVIHLHVASNNSFWRKRYLFKLAVSYHKKIIIHLHGAEFMQFYNLASPSKQGRIKEVFDGANTIIALSQQWKENIQTFTSSPVKVIYNAVALPTINEIKDNKNICFLGRIGERKGIFDLLEVVRRLNQEFHEYEVYIGGDGEVERMNTYIHSHQLNNVHYVGWIVGQAKADLFEKCSIFVLPSSNEGLPMALLEAMSYACLPISTYVGGIPEVIENEKNGFLIQPKDQEHLYTILKDIMKDTYPLINMREEARQCIEKRYNLIESLTKLYELYQC